MVNPMDGFNADLISIRPVKMTMTTTNFLRLSILRRVKKRTAVKTPTTPPVTRPANPSQETRLFWIKGLLEAVIIMAASNIMTGMATAGLNPINEKM